MLEKSHAKPERKPTRKNSRGAAALLTITAALAAAIPAILATTATAVEPASGAATGEQLTLLERTNSTAYQKAFRDDNLNAWRKRVPRTTVVRIPSSVDGKKQRAVWYQSGSTRKKPLLVVLHSWSADYEQNLNIPYAEFAIANDWVFVHPDFRGPNLRPEATASEVALQDVMDVVSFARKRASVDPARIYLVGYSGGAMKALVLAGRHPDVWAGIAAWGPIYDIADWYHHNRGREAHYTRGITASCGGPPLPGTAAEAECRARSPLSHLDGAAGRVPILLAHGIRDSTVPPRHALRAYDHLAAAPDRFTQAQRAAIDGQGKLPPELQRPDAGASAGGGPLGGRVAALFREAGLPLLLERQSNQVSLALYDGDHDMAYNPTVQWLSRQRRQQPAQNGKNGGTSGVSRAR